MMIRSLWISKTGMEGQQAQLDAIANNLANSATNGYKRSGVQFEDLMYQNLRPAGANSSEQTLLPTGLQVGLGVRVAATTRNFNQGQIQETGNALDVAINGPGFFMINLPDGTTGYTRDGAFQRDANGQMVTSAGNVLQPGITIPKDAASVTVGADGTVSATFKDKPDPQKLGQIQLASFSNPGGLDPRGGNIYAETASSGAPQNAAPGTGGHGSLTQGYIEGSNVNVVQELVTMIATQRAYELNSKAVQTSDQMLQRLGQL